MVLLLLAALGAALPQPAAGDGEPGTRKYTETVRFRSRSIKALEEMWRQAPVDATAQGMHRYDGTLASWTAASRTARLRALRQLRTSLAASDLSVLNQTDRVDHALVVANLEAARLDLTDARRWERDPIIYADECVNGVFWLLTLPGVPPEKRAASVGGRLRRTPALLGEMSANVTRPPVILARAAAEELSAGAAFFEETLPGVARNLRPAERKAFVAALDRAVRAMRAASRSLERRADAGGDRCAIGRPAYDRLLKAQSFASFDSDSLLRLAERALRESERDAGAARDRSAERSPALSPERWTALFEAQRRFLAERDLVTVPREVAPLVALETPRAWRSLLPGLALQVPAPFEQPFPGDFRMRAEKRLALTEGRLYVYDAGAGPYRGARGRVLPAQDASSAFLAYQLPAWIAGQIVDPVRKAQASTAFVGGWALYAGELVERDGAADRGRSARRVRLAAALASVDARLARGEMTVSDAVAFVERRAGVDRETATHEVARCCHVPGAAAAALIGRDAILALRADYQRAHPGKQALERFHDELLAAGAIPPPLARRVLLPEDRKQTAAR